MSYICIVIKNKHDMKNYFISLLNSDMGNIPAYAKIRINIQDFEYEDDETLDDYTINLVVKIPDENENEFIAMCENDGFIFDYECVTDTVTFVL